jgi:hypothetical protein
MMLPMGEQRTVYSGTVWVAYSQAYVESSDETPMPDRAFGGQANGLCGAAVSGGLFLTTGLHTGRVGFAVEVHDTPPPFGEKWEEIVEVSFTPASPQVFLTEWGGGAGDGPRPLGLAPGDWRARYCGTGMDAASSAGPPADGEEPVDEYLLQFWPAPVSVDRVVRQTSAKAAYWHDFASQQPPPPLPPTPEELAEAERREQRKRQSARERFEVQRDWGGRPPSDRLRHLGGNVRGLAQRDRDLVDELDSAEPSVQRTVAIWAAGRACDIAGLASTDWVATGLDALDRGEPLAPPFDHLPDAFARLSGGSPGRMTMRFVKGSPRGPRSSPPIDPRYAALPAIPAAAHDDPLRAAIDALAAAATAFGDEAQLLFDEVRYTFPSIRCTPHDPFG